MPPSLAASQLLLEQNLRSCFPHQSAAIALSPTIVPEGHLRRDRMSKPGIPALANAEIEKLSTLALPKRRAQWLAGRMCAKKAALGYMARYLPHLPTPDSRDIQIRNLPSGRPTVASTFVDLDNLGLSISHSGGYATALVASTACGIDIQEDSATLERISSRFCHDHELELLQTLPGLDGHHRLNLLWTAKEAARKALDGEHMPGFLELILTSCRITAMGTFSLSLVHNDHNRTPLLTVLATRFDRYFISVTLNTPGSAHA